MSVFGLAFKVRTRINFLHSKWGHFDKARSKFQSLALWLGALSSLFHNMGVEGYGHYPLFVRARHVQRCVKKCPHFECVIHRFVLALNAGTNTLYTHVYSVPSLWMPGQVGVYFYKKFQVYQATVNPKIKIPKLPKIFYFLYFIPLYHHLLIFC